MLKSFLSLHIFLYSSGFMERIAFSFAGVILLTNCLFAQVNRGTLSGVVKDINEAVIVGANVSISGKNGFQITTQTNQNGEFIFRNLPAGSYTVRAESEGFAVYENTEIQVLSEQNAPLEITLNVSLEETEVNISADQPITTQPESNASALVLREDEIAALPDDEEELEAALQALAGASAGPNGGGIFVDGFSGGSLPPRDTIREIRINSNPFSSEFDRLGYGRIEIFTKPGTDRFRGETEFEFEDESLNSRNPFVPERAPFQRREFEVQFGGPIIKNRASFFVNFETESTDNNALVNALVLDRNLNIVPFQMSVAAPDFEIEFNPRFDIMINENNTLIGRYNYEREKSENAGLGGFNLPSRAFAERDTEHILQLTETAVINPTSVNEARFQYIRRRSSEKSENEMPTIRVNDAFISGGANVGFAFSNEDRYEFQNYTSFILNRHSLKFGARIRHIRLLNSSPDNFLGTVTFAGIFNDNGTPDDPDDDVTLTSLEQYRQTLLGNELPTQFSIAGGDPQAGVTQTDYGVFIQDDWRVNPKLTLSFGLRYENQTNIASDFNFAPRFGFAFAPGANGQNSPKTVIRGGFGIFYDRFSENLTLQARRFNGINQQRFIVTDPAILDDIVFSPEGVSNIPTIGQLSDFAQMQTTRIVSPELKTPYTMQTALSIERQMPFNTTVSVTYLNAQTRRLLRSRNINAPLNGVRPFPGEGNIFQYESTGKFSQNQLLFNIRTRIRGVNIFANYALNDANSDTDGAGTFPAFSYDLTGEMGRAALDIRHRFVVGSSFNLPWDIRVRPFLIYRSGQPFNITTGIDENEDTLFTERPAFATELSEPGIIITEFGAFDPTPELDDIIIPRNYGTGPEFFNVNLRMSKSFGFGTRSSGDSGGQGTGRRGRRGGLNNPFGGGRSSRGGRNKEDSRFKVEFTVQVRNLFNRTNLGTPVGNLRSPFFGRSTSLAGGFGFGGGSSAAGNRRIELEVEFEF